MNMTFRKPDTTNQLRVFDTKVKIEAFSKENDYLSGADDLDDTESDYGNSGCRNCGGCMDCCWSGTLRDFYGAGNC